MPQLPSVFSQMGRVKVEGFRSRPKACLCNVTLTCGHIYNNRQTHKSTFHVLLNTSISTLINYSQ